MIDLRPNLRQLEQLRHDLHILTLPDRLKKQVLQRTAWAIKNNALKNVRNQRSPEGLSWEKRKRGTGKMLLHRARYLNSKMPNAFSAMLFYKQRRTAEISAIHQQGLEDTISNEQLTREELRELQRNSGEKVTQQQIVRLKALGYKIPSGRKNKNGKTVWKYPTNAEISQRLTRGQAGIIIRKMKAKYRADSPTRRRGLAIKMPERPFLDTHQQRNSERMTEHLIRVLRENGITFRQ